MSAITTVATNDNQVPAIKDIDPSFYPESASSTHSSAGDSLGSSISSSTSSISLPTMGSQSRPEAVVPPRITARAYIAGNLKTGKIYEQYNSAKSLPVASMSKLITALAYLNEFPLSARITITPEEMTAPPDGSMLQAGESFSFGEIIYPLLLNSSNVAAEALASSTDRTKFLKTMSSYAWEIGMSSTYFADPSGVDPHNKASAKDLFTLALYLTKYRPDLLALTQTPKFTIATTTQHGSHTFTSTHPFINDPNFLGGKTGRTPAAGETMLTIIRIKNQPVAIIVLGSEYGTREKDTRMIMEDVASFL